MTIGHLLTATPTAHHETRSAPLYVYAKGEHVRAKPALKAFLGEYTKETTWGPTGYLKARGLVAAPDDVRSKNAAIVANMTPIDKASVK